MSNSALLAQTTGQWDSIEALLEHLANRDASSFLLPHESVQEVSKLLYKYYPNYVSALLAEADAICNKNISLLGQVFHFSENIDWHRDPITGWQFPTRHRSRMEEFFGALRPVDLIRFWELNRQQHFITLGIAYWLTSDKKYVNVFASQLRGWIETNPIQHGANWYYPLEVSIRLLAWTIAFQFFRKSPEFQETVGSILLKSLWQQADFLNSHLQITRTDVPNNHMLAELTGLIIVGTVFPEFRAATDWCEAGFNLMTQQIITQTHTDGANKEQATGYHRFVTELLLLTVIRGRQGFLPSEPTLEMTLEQMLDFIFSTLSPSGTNPMWGDSDYGRAFRFGTIKDFWDFRSVLSAGAALYNRADWKFAAGRFNEEAFWLLGTAGLDAWEQINAYPPATTSRAFPDAGIYIVRDTWNADTDVAIFRCGPFGLGGEGHCAHAHCDLLGFILWIRGQPVLVDSGTYTYHGPWRDYFRVTSAHNTVMVDGYQQAIPMPNFNWQQVSNARCVDWDGKRVSGTITYPSQVKFIREIFHPRPGQWQILDKFTTQRQGEHYLEWYFHFAPDLDIKLDKNSNGVRIFKDGQSLLEIQVPEHNTDFQLRDSWYSYNYGNKQSNQMLYGTWRGQLANQEAPFCWLFQLTDRTNVQSKGSYDSIARK